ncbi:hypothetical protein RX799_24800 [Klebsiella oxytoca]|uniref:hypothetical protein n=1 Tax=Klebsiella oxytoca TaxID=571 RepID=UPI003850A123
METSAGCKADVIKSLFTALVVFLYGQPVTAAVPENIASATDDMVAALSSVQYFSPANDTARLSNGGKILNIIAHSADTAAVLLEVAMSPSSTPEGKLYAACGLKKLSLQDMDAVFGAHLHLDVSVLRGNVLSREKFRNIYFRIRQSGCD